ncbi:MAG: rhomboid family intramembrane serine protease [bacterium]|nr:rhomboid family intramembrane serine protease [bacterium]MDE0289976.1 rhomboid family intramembrane serine protease [bacterium]MDE0437236.1 rhomboid family intramembrane serine protease [bacterium]
MDSGDSQPPDTVRCYRHPERATALRCSRCERPICGFCSHDSPVGQRCPQCISGSAATRVVTARSLSTGFTPAVLTIIVLSAVVYLLQRQNPQFTVDYAHLTDLVSRGEWWRVITAAFLHSRSSLLHILFNMYALYLFGPRLERQLGAISFVGLYLSSAIAGGVAFQYLSAGGAVGASGAIFGLFGAVLVGTFPLRGTVQGAAQFRQLVLLLAINLALPFFATGIAWEAHVGGLAMGMVVAALWQRIPPTPGAPLLRAMVVYGLGLAALLAIVVT